MTLEKELLTGSSIDCGLADSSSAVGSVDRSSIRIFAAIAEESNGGTASPICR